MADRRYMADLRREIRREEAEARRRQQETLRRDRKQDFLEWAILFGATGAALIWLAHC